MNKLPINLVKYVSTLRRLNGQAVYLLGTAHVSERSVNQVTELIKFVKPSGVFVEVCEQRKAICEENEESLPKEEESFSDIVEQYRSGQANAFTLVYRYIMKAYDLKPGGEFKAAAASARELKVPVILGDRMVGITMMRLWNGLTAWQKTKLIMEMLPLPSFSSSSSEGGMHSLEEKDVNDFLDRTDLITAEVRRMGKKFPWLVEVLIRERDQYMVLELEQALDELEQGDVVAVVGAGHVAGMTQFWEIRQQQCADQQKDDFVSASRQLHLDLQLYPGAQLPRGRIYTKKELQEYAARIGREYSQQQQPVQ